jgi:hypothetical protein
MRCDRRMRGASRRALFLLVLGACSGGERTASVESVDLLITARDGSRHVFADEAVGDDLRWVHLFRGYVAPIDAYVVERRYIPEGGEFLLVEAGTGRTTRIDAPPVPSPDGRRFVTASLDLVAGHTPNRIRVYRMEEGGPVVEWEIEPREWGAQRPTWLDDRTIRLERAVVDWNTHGILSSPMSLRRAPGGWTIESSADHARDALFSFLSALGTGQYIEATLLYGGTYEQFRTWNPGHEPEDRNGLWRLACEHNGLQCLGRAEVVRTEQLSPTAVRFAVRLLDSAGKPFVLGPCCGETEQTMPPKREFAFRVQRMGEQYLVMDLPPYVP